MKKLRAKCALLKNSPLLILFCILLFGMFAIDLATPDKETSEIQNTTLEQRPELDFDRLFSSKFTSELNSYFTDYNDYTKEQVAFRESLINAHSFVETVVFQKTTYGDILLGDDEMMFTRTFGMLASEEVAYPKNLAALTSLSEAYPDKVTVMIAPTANLIYPENVPTDAPLIDTDAMIGESLDLVAAAGANALDVRDTLLAHSDEYIYYRTDHHWTTLGAYYAYEAFCESRGLTPFDLDAHEAVEITDFYGTHYSKSRDWNAIADTITYYPLDNEMSIYKITSSVNREVESTTGLYEVEKFDVYDKYSAFLYGNPGYASIEGDGEGSILVIKDSYANSFVPYLTANYAQIDVIDMRSYYYGLDGLIAQYDYDDILVLYNIDTFKGDSNFQRAGVRGTS